MKKKVILIINTVDLWIEGDDIINTLYDFVFKEDESRGDFNVIDWFTLFTLKDLKLIYERLFIQGAILKYEGCLTDRLHLIEHLNNYTQVETTLTWYRAGEDRKTMFRDFYLTID